MSKRQAEPYITKRGEVKPGDKVFAVTQSTGSTKIYYGEYLGWIESPYSYNKKRVQVKVAQMIRMPYLKGTDELFDYRLHGWGRDLDYRNEYRDRVTTLYDNRIFPADGLSARELAELV